jgi:FkbM family methyltransferase
MRDDLIFDVGAHNGDDSGYYLEKGYRVVAVEANPLLAQSITERFEAAIQTGRLTVLNVGIADRSGTLPFWVNADNSVWSSFDRELGGRHGSRCHPVDIECVPLDALIRQYGVPHYLKIDIEGYDRICLDALHPSKCPRYLSCELTHSNPLIDRLYELGYRQFKLVNQSTYTDATPVFENEIGFRAVRKLCVLLPAVRRALPDGVRSDFDTFTRRHGHVFPEGASGPFGEDTFGPWRTKEMVEHQYDEIRRRFLRAGVSLEQCWYDIHAARFDPDASIKFLLLRSRHATCSTQPAMRDA